MTDYGSIASADIRKYIWQKIQDANILDRSDYYADGMMDSLTPIIPTQQIPEFNNLLPGRTYMLYDFEVKAVPVQWWMTEESFTLSVISQSYDTINEIMNLMHDLFRRYDESADELNKFLGPSSDFIFRHTMIEAIMSPEPFSAEGDYQTGSVVFSYTYSRKTGANGRF